MHVKAPFRKTPTPESTPSWNCDAVQGHPSKHLITIPSYEGDADQWGCRRGGSKRACPLGEVWSPEHRAKLPENTPYSPDGGSHILPRAVKDPTTFMAPQPLGEILFFGKTKCPNRGRWWPTDNRSHAGLSGATSSGSNLKPEQNPHIILLRMLLDESGLGR